MKYLRFSLAAVVTLLLMAGCAGLGDVFGTGSPTNNPTTAQNAEIQGTVNNVDTNARRIDVAVNSGSAYPTNQTTSVYYDSRTQFVYQNRVMSAADLRRGDQVDVRAVNNGNGQYTADTVYVNSSGMASNYPGTYPSTAPGSQTFDVQGTVNYVDTTAQRIDLTSAYITGLRTGSGQGNYSIYYDSRTSVNYQGQSYSPTALERGDQIDVNAYDSGNGRYMANSINVTRNIRQQ